MGRIELILPQDRVYGQGTGFIMVAFAYPGAASRFSDGSAGTYYAAHSVATAIAETRYHAELYLRGSDPCVTEKIVIEADLDGTFLDVRRPRPAPPGIYDPVDYRVGQALGDVVRQMLGFGILYDSVRDPDGVCVAVTRPPVLRHAVAVRTLQYVWDGTRVTHVE
ncbi:MAG: RES family NAD+ phosphorylase [bacterium]